MASWCTFIFKSILQKKIRTLAIQYKTKNILLTFLIPIFDYKIMLKEYTPKLRFCENALTLRPSKMYMSLFLHMNRFEEIMHYITCSPMDPLQWMGAVRMSPNSWMPTHAVRMSPNSWKKHRNNTQVIHTTPVHQLTSCKMQVFVRNKSTIKAF